MAIDITASAGVFDEAAELLVMRRVFDDVAYARGERGTRVSLRARLPDTACEPFAMRP